MTASLAVMRPVYVVGIGLHPYQFPTLTPYVTLGLAAIREALTDAGLAWSDVASAYVGSGSLGMAAGRVMVRHLGSTGLSIQQCENASASGSTAFRLACLDVAAGMSDVALAVGVDKTGPHVQRAATRDGFPRFSAAADLPVVKFALMAQDYMRRTGCTVEQIAAVAVKNHGNAARNPYAQFRKVRTLEQVLASPKVAGVLTVMQCCPRGDGAAAVIVASADGIRRLGLDRARAVRVLASVTESEQPAQEESAGAIELTRRVASRAYHESGLGPADINVCELHEAFSIEELAYLEALQICPEGEGGRYVASGSASIGGGGCAVNPSGGLLGMGHPIGPTGVGQIAEITRQLRGEAGERQHPGARTGFAQMIGLGQVGLAHILQSG